MSTSGFGGSLKVEIGYMRRIALLRDDARLPFIHPVTGARTLVKTPQKEEQFASKVCTLVSRKGSFSYPRDQFDVSMISRQEYDWDLMVDLVLIDSLLDGLDLATAKPKPVDIDQVGRLNRIVRERVDLHVIIKEAGEFFDCVRRSALDRGWEEFNDEFKASGKVKLDLLRNPSKINPDIERHPQLLWLRRKRDK
jgi:hypothetical protein